MVKRSVVLITISSIVAVACLIGCRKNVAVAPFSSSSRVDNEAAKQRKAEAQGNYANKAKEAYLKAQKQK
jgi:hypothetical protein